MGQIVEDANNDFFLFFFYTLMYSPKIQLRNFSPWFDQLHVSQLKPPSKIKKAKNLTEIRGRVWLALQQKAKMKTKTFKLQINNWNIINTKY